MHKLDDIYYLSYCTLRTTNNILILTHPFIFQRLGQPIQDRHREHEDRPRAFDELGKKLQLYMKFVDSYKQKVFVIVFAYNDYYYNYGSDK